jgi:predicted MFS family arabinose efflux permease
MSRFRIINSRSICLKRHFRVKSENIRLEWQPLKDRTVLGACLLSFTLFISYSCWASYFTSFLQVVNGLSATNASYVVQTCTVGGVLFSYRQCYQLHRSL